MRYALMVLGAACLVLGFLMFTTARHPEHVAQATVVLQLGGIFLAVGAEDAQGEGLGVEIGIR